MGLSSLPTPSESVMTLILVNTAVTISILKEIVGSVLRQLGFRLQSDSESEDQLLQESSSSGGGGGGGGGGSASCEPSLTERFRSRFKPIRFGRRRAGVDCRVCLSRFEPESEVDRLPCGHVFHKACLEGWLDYHHVTCPLCRTQLLPPAPAPATDFASYSTSLPWF